MIEGVNMKILSIGNSFSMDATRYIHQMAKNCGENIKSVNLYIGGCSLKTHYLNIIEDARNYLLEFNGESTGVKISVKDALISDEWDYITVQQVSNETVNYDTYQPYLNELAAYVKKYCPQSKIIIHQTWAYEENSERLCKEMGYKTSSDMMDSIIKSYKKAYKEIKADGIIPCGEVFKKATELGVKKIHRDTFHASLGLGRYALALTWLCYFTDKTPKEISFYELDEPASNEEISIVKKAVSEILKK